MDPHLIPVNRPERCLYFEHRWTGWGLWEHVHPAPPRYYDDGNEPMLGSVMARRFRQCRCCGSDQMQTYDGKIRTVADPHKIEDHRLRDGFYERANVA